jgi:hypothetical protein
MSGHKRASARPAQQRLMRQIAAGRQARQQRVLLMLLGAMCSLVLVASGGAWVLTSYVTHQTPQTRGHARSREGHRPAETRRTPADGKQTAR